MHVRVFAIVLAMMTMVEVTAWVLKLWTYDRAWHRLTNILVPGVLMALLAVLLVDAPIVLRFALGAAIGVAYEVLNLRWFRLWSFPNARFLGFRNDLTIALASGVPWGFVLAIPPVLARSL